MHQELNINNLHKAITLVQSIQKPGYVQILHLSPLKIQILHKTGSLANMGNYALENNF